MLLLGGAATVEALTGLDYRLASFLIPWGVILYTASGGLQATFMASYIHTVIIYMVLITMIFIVYIKVYSSDTIYRFLDKTVSYNQTECEAIYSSDGMGGNTTFYDAATYACGPVSGNHEGSYLTMISADGLMFGIINIVGNFGTVFADQSYWQSAIAASPSSAAKGYLLGGYVTSSCICLVFGTLVALLWYFLCFCNALHLILTLCTSSYFVHSRICWFAIPFSLATSLGLASTALMLPITAGEAGSGLVPPAVAAELLGNAGSVLILIMLFMAIVSTGSAESIAVSSLVAYDIYREYINPEATGDQILKVSRIVIVAFGLFMGMFSIVLFEIGLNLGWVYLFMGVVIGSAVIPLWNMMTWKKASGTGAIIAAWGGFALAVTGWLSAAKIQSGEVSIDTLGTNEVMLSGNLIAILSSGIIHFLYSTFIDPQDYDFAELDRHITLVEVDDTRGLTDDEKDPVLLAKAETWIKRRGWVLTIILVIIWPLSSVPAGTFTESYFAFWVLIAIAWGFGAALIIAVLPLTESSEAILNVFTGMYNSVTGNQPEATSDLVDDENTPFKTLETASKLDDSGSDEQIEGLGTDKKLDDSGSGEPVEA